MKQGEIRPLLADISPTRRYVLVVSGPNYLAAGKGRVVACKVVPGVVPDEFTSVHRVSYRAEDGVDTIGLAVPDLIDWYPAAAMGEPVGHVSDMAPVIKLLTSLLR